MTHAAIEIHLRAVGCLMLGIAALSVYVPRRFGWGAEIGRLTLLTRQVFVVHAAFVSVAVRLLFAGHAGAFTQPGPLPRAVLAGMLVLWGARLLAQWFYYDARLWRGNRLHTAMHVLFSGIYTYFVAVFTIALLVQVRGVNP
jgi:hypothetical protein